MSKPRARIKILFLIDELAAGGTEKQLILLAEKLPREYIDPVIGVLQRNDYQNKLKIQAPIVTFNLSGPPFLRNVSLIWRLKRYLDKGKFDIIQFHFAESEIYGSVAAKLCRHRLTLISTRRDLYYWIKEEQRVFRISRRTIHWSDHVLANSYKASQICLELEKFPREKITVIQNGIEVDKFNKIPTEEAKGLIDLEGEYPVVGAVGNWRPIKGLASFLKAADLVFSKTQNARFVLAGAGPQENELRSLAHNLGIYHRVTFLRSPTDIPTVMAALDVAVQPSLSESFSNVLIEYMAAARPIVATRVGDAEKVIENGKDGLLIQPEKPHQLSSAILSLCNNRDRASEMGQRAREKVVANWSLEMMVEKYLLFYQGLFHPEREKID